MAEPLDPVSPVMFFDALRVKIRDESVVKNKAVYLVLALDCEGQKHVLGLWIEQSDRSGATVRRMSFWSAQAHSRRTSAAQGSTSQS